VNLSFPQLLAGSIGALLIYSAIVGKTPVSVLKQAWGETGPGAATVGPYVRPTTTATGQARSNTAQPNGPGKRAA
jgi:hypothetical protein